MNELQGLIEEYGGIQPPHLAFYMESIRFNSENSGDTIPNSWHIEFKLSIVSPELP